MIVLTTAAEWNALAAGTQEAQSDVRLGANVVFDTVPSSALDLGSWSFDGRGYTVRVRDGRTATMPGLFSGSGSRITNFRLVFEPHPGTRSPTPKTGSAFVLHRGGDVTIERVRVVGGVLQPHTGAILGCSGVRGSFRVRECAVFLAGVRGSPASGCTGGIMAGWNASVTASIEDCSVVCETPVGGQFGGILGMAGTGRVALRRCAVRARWALGTPGMHGGLIARVAGAPSVNVSECYVLATLHGPRAAADALGTFGTAVGGVTGDYASTRVRVQGCRLEVQWALPPDGPPATTMDPSYATLGAAFGDLAMPDTQGRPALETRVDLTDSLLIAPAALPVSGTVELPLTLTDVESPHARTTAGVGGATIVGSVRTLARAKDQAWVPEGLRRAPWARNAAPGPRLLLTTEEPQYALTLEQKLVAGKTALPTLAPSPAPLSVPEVAVETDGVAHLSWNHLRDLSESLPLDYVTFVPQPQLALSFHGEVITQPTHLTPEQLRDGGFVARLLPAVRRLRSLPLQPGADLTYYPTSLNEGSPAAVERRLRILAQQCIVSRRGSDVRVRLRSGQPVALTQLRPGQYLAGPAGDVRRVVRVTHQQVPVALCVTLRHPGQPPLQLTPNHLVRHGTTMVPAARVGAGALSTVHDTHLWHVATEPWGALAVNGYWIESQAYSRTTWQQRATGTRPWPALRVSKRPTSLLRKARW